MSTWLNNHLMHGPYLALCTTEAAYLRAMKHLKVKNAQPWLSKGSTKATCHTFENPQHGIVCVVCMRPDVEPVQAISTLVHEAVHVWQEYREYIGETHPGKEQEAYSIQNIAMTLIDAFGKQTSVSVAQPK